MVAALLGVFDVSLQGGEPSELAALARGGTWLNSQPLTMADLRGKVILVDFCTYTCINWMRTLPYLRAWSESYRNIVLIGVHTPEFEFEHDVANVRRALAMLNVSYPVVLDNDYTIWRAFENHYWPALYLIDRQGRVRNHQFGEGNYERWESSIQRLVDEGAGGRRPLSGPNVNATGIEAAADWGNLRMAETYTGYERTQNFASRDGLDRNRRRTYTAPGRLQLHQWALVGEWTVGAQATSLNGPSGRIALNFQARDVHMVMAPSRPERPVRFRVTLKGAGSSARGLDVDESGNGIVTEPRLYQLIRQSDPIGERLFEIEFFDAGVEVYSFTFG